MTLLRRVLSKFAALALLAGVVFFGYAAVISPLVVRVTDTRDRIVEQRMLLGRLASATAQEGGAMALETQAKSALNDGAFLPGASDAIRIAELQSLLSRVAEAEGVQLKSTRALQPREHESIRLLGVEAQLSASIEQLQRILFKLETGRPQLFVESLQVTPQAAFSLSGAPESGSLEIHLAVAGAVGQKKG